MNTVGIGRPSGRVAQGMPKLSARRIAIATGGTLVAVICASVTIHWFGDGHPTTRVGSVLAWLGFLGLSIAAGALSLPTLRRQRSTRAA
ncbi:MAG: hypothetical protein ACXVRV_15505 [Gaiellaceae bacterium]